MSRDERASLATMVLAAVILVTLLAWHVSTHHRTANPDSVRSDLAGYCAERGQIPDAWTETDNDGTTNVYGRCVTISEDDPRWNCSTNGNGLCGRLEIGESVPQQLRRILERAKSAVASEAQQSANMTGVVAVVDVKQVIAGRRGGCLAHGTLAALRGEQGVVLLTAKTVFLHPLMLAMPGASTVDAPSAQARSRPIGTTPVLVERQDSTASLARFGLHGTELSSMGNRQCGPTTRPQR